MYLEFMTRDVWDGLVIGTTLIGLSLAVLQLLKNYLKSFHKIIW